MSSSILHVHRFHSNSDSIAMGRNVTFTTGLQGLTSARFITIHASNCLVGFYIWRPSEGRRKVMEKDIVWSYDSNTIPHQKDRSSSLSHREKSHGSQGQDTIKTAALPKRLLKQSSEILMKQSVCCCQERSRDGLEVKTKLGIVTV